MIRRLRQRLARKLGCEHHEIVVEPDVVDLLPSLTWHMDEPTADPAIITAYLVCREARKKATVLLSGVGGDEIFAGYRKHVAHAWAEEYRRVPAFARSAAEQALLSLPSLRGTPMKGSLRLAKKMARSAALSPVEAFIRNCTYLDGQQKAALYARPSSHQSDSNPASQHLAAFGKVRHADFLNQMLYLDTKIFMTTLNLTYNDKMSMASSVEVRVPFLIASLPSLLPGMCRRVEAEREMASGDQAHLPRSHAQYAAARSHASAESGIRGAGRLLAGKRVASHGRRSAFGEPDPQAGIVSSRSGAPVHRRATAGHGRLVNADMAIVNA